MIFSAHSGEFATTNDSDRVYRTVSYAPLSVLHTRVQLSGRQRTAGLFVSTAGADAAGALQIYRGAADEGGI